MNQQTPPTPGDPAAGIQVDEHGNVTGVWFTVKTDHFVEFSDQAVVYTPPRKEPEQPGA